MFCTNCGSKLPEGARFCSVCGVRVAETEPEEKVVTPLDLDFSDVKPVEAPMKTRVTFDWSNVIDEPHRRNTETIKSPWETSSSVEEDVLSDVKPSTDRSRTMSFIDVLKAEKEQQAVVEEKPVEEPISELEEMIAEDSENAQGIEYTEVLDPGFREAVNVEVKREEVEDVETEFKEPEMPELHFAPLFDDVEEPVKSPFEQEETTEPEFEEPEFEEPVAEEEPVEFAEEPAAEEEPVEENKDDWFEMPVFLQPREDRVAFEEAPVIEAHEVEIPAVEKNVEDLFVEKEEVEEAPAVDDSAIDEAGLAEELQKVLEENAPAEEPEAEEVEVEEPVVEEVVEEIPEEVEAPTLDFTEVEEAPVEVFEPVTELPVEEPVEEPVVEAPVEEVAEETAEPVVEEAAAEDTVDALVDEYDDYMNIETEQRVGRGHRSEQYVDEFEDDDDDEDEEEEDTVVEVASEEPETFDEVPEYEEDDFEEPAEEPAEEVVEAVEDDYVDEDELFDSMELPKHSGMTIAAPADRESEIEALKARLAELMGVSAVDAVAEEPEVEEPAEEVVEEPVAEEPAEVVVEAPVAEEPAEEVVEEPVAEEPAEVVVEAPVFDESVISDHGFEDELAAYLSMDDPTVEKSEESEAKHSHAAPEDDFEDEEEVEEAEAEEPAEEVVEEPVAEAPAEEVVEEPVAEEPVVEVVEEPVAEEPAEPTIDDILAAVLKEAAIPASETVAVVPAVDLVPEAPEVPAVEEEPEAAPEPEFVVPTLEDLFNEPEAEEPAEEPVVEETAEAKETDAVSLEDLEKDLFGTTPEEDAEAEVTKKIDKFYTLYRKNEEFQRLLDEEYNKLKAAGGTAPEPVLPDLEPQRPVEDATIYQPLDKPLEELAKEEAAKAAAKAEEANPAAKPVVKDDAPAEKVEAKDAVIPVVAVAGAAAVAAEAETKGQGPEVEYEEVDKGGTFLTVLAVIIALLLVVLLAVLLILNLAETSSAAKWLDSIIENISSHFTVIDGAITQYWL